MKSWSFQAHDFDIETDISIYTVFTFYYTYCWRDIGQFQLDIGFRKFRRFCRPVVQYGPTLKILSEDRQR